MGLDLSLTGTGVVIYSNGKVLRKLLIPTAKNNNDRLPARMTPSGKFIGNEDERVEYIAGQIWKMYKRYLPVLTAIEGVAYSKQKGQRGNVGRFELQGVVKWRLRRRQALFYTPSPSEVKKWVTGNGQADKDRMIAAARAAGCKTDDENIADAWACAVHAWDQGLGLLEPV